jgi:hypothetical protein
MTSLYAKMDDSGLYPVELQSIPREGWVALPAGTAAEVAVAMMLVEGAWVARPAIAAPTITRTDAGWAVAYTAPDGAVCAVVDRDLGWLANVEALGGYIEFLLGDAGPYQLEVTAPLPWLGRTDNLVLA